jgi:pyruvate/2-oxoglutarate dehydrogenase complex dihydrolipoamide dehydrogenase (E3) component
VLRRRDEVIHDLDDASQLPWLEERGIALLRGVGEIVGERRVRVGDEEVEATQAVIVSTGSLPAMPPVEGLDAIDDAWTNREATTTKEIPDRLVIMGGGVVGVEMSQAFQTLGTHVTLIEGEQRLIPREEEFACVQLTDALAEYGVDIRTAVDATRVEQRGDDVVVTTSDGREATGDTLLVAVGRKPQTKGIGLEALGIGTDAPVAVDALMRVPGHPWLYAIGDVNGRALFTHMGKYQARIAADCIAGLQTAVSHGADGPLSPRVIFTEPQVAAVGHTSDTASEAGLDVQIVETTTSGNAGGSFYGRNATGTARLLVDRERRVVVGATITGAEVSELLHAATVAIVGEIPLERLRHAVPCFPTRSEIWLSLLSDAGV